jgi:hypothetical protein
MESHSPNYKPTYVDLVRQVCELTLEDSVALRNFLNTRIPVLVAESEWARQQACPHTDAKEYGAADHRYWYCPTCKLRQDKGLTRSAR